MKITLIVLAVIYQVVGKTSLKKSKNEVKRGENGENSEAVTYSDGRQSTGLNFALGSNGGYVVSDERNFSKNYQKVDKLRPMPPMPRGPKEFVDEIPSNTHYYDGEFKLNAMKVNCHVYGTIFDCTHQPQCGWCHKTAGCIMGNNLGPMESCPTSQYVFDYPGNGVEDRVRVTNIDTNSLSIRTYSSDHVNPNWG